ncbi:MAG: hypothetical protein H7Y31_01530 [Chitinophagaceae bacterium]|nr:hypothetical protein [Chitinophagaceae bacterium]
MKSQMKFSAITAFVTILLLVATSSLQPLSAQRSAIAVNGEGKPELQVKFIGSTGDYLFFELVMQQGDDSRSSLRIRNENGSELYSESVFLRNSVRKLKIAKDEAEKIEFVYNTSRGEVRKMVEIKIKLQEAIEVKDITKL